MAKALLLSLQLLHWLLIAGVALIAVGLIGPLWPDQCPGRSNHRAKFRAAPPVVVE
jgi:hypothetical protein